MKTATLTAKFTSLVAAAFLLLSLSGCFSIYGRVNWDFYEKEAVRIGETSPIPKPLYMGITNPDPPVKGHNVAILIPFIPILLAELPLEIAFDTLCLPYDIPSYYWDKAKQKQNRLAAQDEFLAPGERVPEVDIRDLAPIDDLPAINRNVKRYNLSVFRGKPVLLHFWYGEQKNGAVEDDGKTPNLPFLREVHQKFGEYLTVLSLTNYNYYRLDKFAKSQGMIWKTGRHYMAYKTFHFDPKKPFYVLIDANGRIVAHSTEGVPLKPPASLPAAQSEKEALQVVASILTNSAQPQ